MNKTTTTPIILTADTLSTATDALVKQAQSGNLTKSQALNILAATISGPKHNWGFLKGSDKPVYAKGMDLASTKTALGATAVQKDVISLAIYTHKHGEDIRAFLNDEGAKQWRQDLALEHWDSEFPDVPEPEDAEDAAERYFGSASEYFTIQNCRLQQSEEVSVSFSGATTGKSLQQLDAEMAALKEQRKKAVEEFASGIYAESLKQGAGGVRYFRDARSEQDFKHLDEIVKAAASEFAENEAEGKYSDYVAHKSSDLGILVNQECTSLLAGRLLAWAECPEDWKQQYEANLAADEKENEVSPGFGKAYI